MQIQDSVIVYTTWQYPDQYVAYTSTTGWVIFPSTENGWEQRRPARGLDPMHLRRVTAKQLLNTGIPCRFDARETVSVRKAA
jgi:hypothetical protein